MTNFIPLFPLELVVFPGEKVNLHIFEPRFKQMVRECIATEKTFGIAPVIDGQRAERGTSMKVVQVVKEYEDGRMDIVTEGLQVFRILEVIKDVPDKLYQGAIVNYTDIGSQGNRNVMRKVLDGLRSIHKSLDIQKPFLKPDEELLSYDVAHYLGLSLREEYNLLEYENEMHRQEFLKRKIENILLAMEDVDRMRKRAAQNGHFKDMKGFNL